MRSRRFLPSLTVALCLGCGTSSPGPALNKPAPPVTATDLDGQPFSLAALKGKVVVLDVWATWCPPCRAMVPHEKEMVAKYAGRPFAFVGVAADDTAEPVKAFVKDQGMAWTHIQEAPGGPIHAAYGIEFYPSIFVIDAKGVVRYKHVRGEALDTAVEKLMKEAGA